MREIVSPQAYPPEILDRLQRGRNLLISIANRWMLGWPERVATLLEQQEYWEALESQVEQELEAWILATQSGEERDLAQWEISEQAGLNLAPPAP